jgi:DNA-binding transcriptional ArsR family regulator
MPNLNTHLDQTFQALADPTRRAVIARLIEGPASVKELAAPFDMALPSFMQHLKALESGGLIRSHKQGRVRTCRLETARLAQASDWLSAQRRLWEGRLDRLETYLDTLKQQDMRDE